MTEFLDWKKVSSIWEMLPSRKSKLRRQAVETDNMALAYCPICHRLLKIREIIVSCQGFNYHFSCFNQEAEANHEILKVENDSLKDKIEQLEKEKKFLFGLVSA